MIPNNPPYKVGLDLGGSKIEIIVLSPSGQSLFRQRIPTPQAQDYLDLSQQYQAILTSIEQLLATASRQLNINFHHIGIGIPGAISPATGWVKNANTICLIGRPFQQDLATKLNCKVSLGNDADCFVLSEAMDGAGQGASSVFGVIIGTGCGGGIVINQQLLNGPNAICGEWGHNPLPWAEVDEEYLPCYCGKKGCIETFLSGPGFTQQANSFSEEFLAKNPGHQQKIAAHTATDWHELLLLKDPLAVKIFNRYAYQLAKALASIINVLDPEVIVLGGGMSNIDYLYQRVPEILPEYVFSDQVLTRLVKAKHGDSSGVRGAAFLG